MNIGQFNARGINNIEHWYTLIRDELKRQGHEVRQFSLRYKQPKREDIEWMDFAVFHFAQVAQYFKRIKKPFCVLPSANDVFPDNGAKLKNLVKVKNCKFISYQSSYHLKKYGEWGIKHNFHYVPMPVRTELFKRSKPYNKNGSYIAGGRLVEKKGLYKLRYLKDNLVIFGDGPLRSTLESTLKAMFVGELWDEQLKMAYEKSSVYLFPAIKTMSGDSDGIPNTVKEAMLMRLPVIASSVAGIPELENITLLDNWSKINEILPDCLHPNWKGEQEIRKLYNPRNCTNMLLDGIERYG